MSPTSFGLSETPKGWDWNRAAFSRLAATLRRAGCQVINPAELDAEIGLGEEWHVYIRRDIKALADCTGIVLLRGWEKSKGARLELHIALELGMDVLYEWVIEEMSPFELRARA